MKSFTILSVSLTLGISFNNCNAADKKDVLGIGTAVFDVYVTCQSDAELHQYIHGIDIKKGDGVAIDRSIAQMLAKRISSPSKQNAGGSIPNVIAGMASLGGKVGLVSARGNDAYGKAFDQDITNLGAEHFCTIRDTVGTGVVYPLITPDGQRTLPWYLGASLMINPDDFQIDRIKQFKILVSDGYLWCSESCGEMMKKAFSAAHEAGVKTAFGLASPYTATTFKDQFIKLLPNIDIVVGNEEEFYCLYDTKNLDDVYNAVRQMVPLAVITRGSDGAVIITHDEIIHVPVQHKVTNVVDTTGAGDMFLAGFLYGQTHDMDIKKSAMLGNALAGRLIQQIGARPEFDTKEILRIF